jgi:subtilisin family serine protease
MFLTILFSFFTSFFSYTTSSEPTDRWMIELKSQDVSCLEDWWTAHDLDKGSFLKKPLRVGNWWVVVVPQRLSSSLHAQPCVIRATKDEKIEWRKQPNDPVYINQSDMNLIGMPKAWDISTGGVTAQGDTIVVAMIDDGYQIDHVDLAANIYRNRIEIAGDGIDNDGNGYIDDHLGLNIQTGNDDHDLRSHGTSVCGIVGAKGNNNIGVSGVNWDVKLLLISSADSASDVIEAYQYILDMRELYDETDGAEGAFIVATNLSGGINNAFAVDYPMWCEMYDKLGARGILSITAAPNISTSVDVTGDMPTTCTSPYMIAVTNVNLSDEISANAGYGATSIDMGAPGHGTVTIASGNLYKEFNGTSAAAPHVAGTVALIYSTPCAEFLYDLETDPSTTASRIRNIILGTGKDNNSLDEITVTGKRLQVDAAMRATVTDCGGSTESEIQILSIRPNPSLDRGVVKVYFEVTGDITGAYFEIFDAVGKKIAEIPVDVVNAADGYIELDSLSLFAGVYFITLRKGDKKVTRKLVMTI